MLKFYMSHKTAPELKSLLAEAAELVPRGSLWSHYKNPLHLYSIADLVIIEASEEVGVVYEAEYESLKGVRFLRPLSDFLAAVEWEGETRKRFTLN